MFGTFPNYNINIDIGYFTSLLFYADTLQIQYNILMHITHIRVTYIGYK